MKSYSFNVIGYKLEYIKVNSCVSRVRITKGERILVSKNIYKGVVKEAYKKQKRGE